MDTLKREKLRVEGLCKRFGDKEVLRSLDFCVYKGEFLSILGPSGCGKTTILRILVGLLQADGGKVWKDGEEIGGRSPAQRGMGVVFQNYALFPNMSVLGNVEYALRRHRETRANAREMALQNIEMVGLTEHVAKKPAALSGGQQQRVAIARTLAMNPDVIFFDEPMSALDVSTRLSLREQIKSIQKRFNTTMIYITHDQEEAFAMSDRIMVMQEGEIQQMDTPAMLLHHPGNAFVEKFVVQNLKTKLEFIKQFMKCEEGDDAGWC